MTVSILLPLNFVIWKACGVEGGANAQGTSTLVGRRRVSCWTHLSMVPASLYTGTTCNCANKNVRLTLRKPFRSGFIGDILTFFVASLNFLLFYWWRCLLGHLGQINLPYIQSWIRIAVLLLVFLKCLLAGQCLLPATSNWWNQGIRTCQRGVVWNEGLDPSWKCIQYVQETCWRLFFFVKTLFPSEAIMRRTKTLHVGFPGTTLHRNPDPSGTYIWQICSGRYVLDKI